MAEKIAIIGGGVAGLTAGYLLHEKYDVTLFEKDKRIGGNAYTLDTQNGEEIDISIFFYSRLKYPNFCKLLSRLGFKSTTLPMEGLSESFYDLETKKSYYLSCDPTRLLSIFRLRNLKAIFHQLIVLWYYFRGIRMCKAGKFRGMKLKEAITYLPALKGEKLKIAIFPICIMTSMFWNELMEAPADFVFGKIDKQCGTPRKFLSWRLFPCKTRQYVQKLAEPFKNKIVLGSEIQSVSREKSSVTIKMTDGTKQTFDKVIFACPADTALELLERPTEEEKSLMGVWRYTDGLVIVHKDKSKYPPEKNWGMYGYIYSGTEDDLSLSINAYYRYQNGVPNNSEYIGIQHPNIEIDKNLIEFQKVFRTPIYDFNSTRVISELPNLNGKMNSYFCGSHFGYGLHEDAVTSAISVAKLLGVKW